MGSSNSAAASKNTRVFFSPVNPKSRAGVPPALGGSAAGLLAMTRSHGRRDACPTLVSARQGPGADYSTRPENSGLREFHAQTREGHAIS